MTTTVGISAERTVVRGVLLSSAPGKRPEVLQAVEQRVADGGSIVGVLEALTESSPVVADVAVAYLTAEDRQRIVSQLADGQWRASSLVSTRSALFALVGDLPELTEFETVVLLNLADRTATAVVVGPDRRQILASDTWTTGFADDASLDGPVAAFDADAIAHLRSMLESIPAHPGAVALCGSSAADPEIAGALRYELTARVVLVPDFAEATARGAALIAADQVRQQSAGTPRAPRRPKRLLLTAAALAAFLGVSGFAVAQVLHDSTPATNAGSLDTTSPSPTSAPTTVEAPLPTSLAASPQPPTQPAPPPPPAPAPAPAPDPGIPPAAAPAPPPAATTPTAPRGPKPPTRVPAPEEGPTDSPAPPSSPEAPAPSNSPTPTKVGAPGPQGLFPGESPPPAAGSDPAAEQAWWANHWNLKQQWMNGR